MFPGSSRLRTRLGLGASGSVRAPNQYHSAKCAEVVKIFDSWAGSLTGEDFARYAVEPARKITAALKARKSV